MNNKKINSQLFFLAIILTFSSLNSFSQTGEYVEIRDLETWSSIEFEYKLNKKWEFGFEEQLRLKNNSSIVSSFFSEANVSYQLFKNFNIGTGLRYIRENDNVGNIQGYENHYRYNFDLSYKQKINRFKIKYRLRYQNNEEFLFNDFSIYEPVKQIRFKSSLNYNIKNFKLDPTFSAEIFDKFDQSGTIFNKFRFTIGTDYKLKKFGEFTLYYRMEKELNVSTPKTTNIFGLKYKYTF